MEVPVDWIPPVPRVRQVPALLHEPADRAPAQSHGPASGDPKGRGGSRRTAPHDDCVLVGAHTRASRSRWDGPKVLTSPWLLRGRTRRSPCPPTR